MTGMPSSGKRLELGTRDEEPSPSFPARAGTVFDMNPDFTWPTIEHVIADRRDDGSTYETFEQNSPQPNIRGIRACA